jgi:colanic acid/amylovoran biosynthesis protein
MKSFYLSGHRTFDNRGCEAIVRSTVGLLRQKFGAIEVLVPSEDISRDTAQWPDAATFGVEFVPGYFPAHARYWANLQRLPIPSLKTAGWPFPMSEAFKVLLQRVDVVLSVGGDNYSLDYRLPSLLMGVDRLAMNLRKPVVLWGASVGPFENVPAFVPVIRKHLADMSLIAVRESVSDNYLNETLELNNIIRMADPAFTLIPELVSTVAFWPVEEGNGVLGLNISPVIERYRNSGTDLRTEIVEFIRVAVKNYDMSVLLIPHVVPLDGDSKNNDADYMRPMLDSLRNLGPRVRMMDSTLNAAQIKQVISQCRFFIGARTHATIAALSSIVPTVSIAYSIKAKGINQDLFGHQDAVIDSSEVSQTSLLAGLKWLHTNEQELCGQLTLSLVVVKKKIDCAMERIREFV